MSSWFHKNLHNSGMVGSRKLPDPSLNHIFSAVSISVLSNMRSNFGLKCLFKATQDSCLKLRWKMQKQLVQNLRKNPYVGVSFLKTLPQHYLKADSNTGVLVWIL